MTFTYSSETLQALKRSITVDRLAPYLELSEGDLEGAVALYERNAKLSAAFYWPLQGLEVAVRNEIDAHFRAKFGEDWTSLNRIPLQQPQKDDVFNAIRDAGKAEDGEPRDYTHGDIIANLRFGFWVGVLGPKNEVEIWRKCLCEAFPHRPREIQRKAIQGALNSIRRLRNRVAHHCRIIHRDLERDHATILEVASWVCPDTSAWIASLSTFDPSIIPVPQTSLPMDGLPETDQVPPAGVFERAAPPTRNGRPRLGIKP